MSDEKKEQKPWPKSPPYDPFKDPRVTIVLTKEDLKKA